MTHLKPCNKSGAELGLEPTPTASQLRVGFTSAHPLLRSPLFGQPPKQPQSPKANNPETLLRNICLSHCLITVVIIHWGTVLTSLQNTFRSFISPSIHFYLPTPYTFCTCQPLNVQCSPRERQFLWWWNPDLWSQTA